MVGQPYRQGYALMSSPNTAINWPCFCFMFIQFDTQPRFITHIGKSVLNLNAACKYLLQSLIDWRVFLNTKIARTYWQMHISGYPYRRNIPGPCHAVRTPNISLKIASFLAGVIPPIVLTWQRIKSICWLIINGLYSLTFVNNSPIAIGVDDCWRINFNHSRFSGATGSSR